MLKSHTGIIRDWYNGYSYGEQTIYNPWSVISYIQAIPNPPGPKWLNTSSNALVYEELATGGLEIKRDLEILLSGERFAIRYLKPLPFLISEKSDEHLEFLYYSGYLKAENPQPDLRGGLPINFQSQIGKLVTCMNISLSHFMIRQMVGLMHL